MDTFHMGISSEKKKRKRYKKDDGVVQPIPPWRIIPCSEEELLVIDTLKGGSYPTKMQSLEEYGKEWLEPSNELFAEHTFLLTFAESIKEIKERCKTLLMQNQTLRWKFKRFVSRWRIHRFRELNETDFITMNPFVEGAIRIYSFSLRVISLFEASSLLTHIHRQLLHHSGSIPEPISPRNPYTNTNFTLAELISIRKQCKEKGESVWTFEAFAKNQYNIIQFLNYNRKSLRIHAMKSILYNFADYDGIDILLNFIESQHEEHQANYHKNIYLWCLLKIPDAQRIQEWRSLCHQYYECEILAEDEISKENAFYIALIKSEALCSHPYELIAKRKQFLRTNQ